MGWERIVLSLENFKASDEFAIQDAFTMMWIPLGTPEDAVLYRRYDNEANIAEYFLSPRAAEISKATMAPFNPEPEAKPDLSKLTPIVFNGMPK